MTVLWFPVRPNRPSGDWSAAELQQVADACDSAILEGGASGWDVGITDCGDPQLYVVGAAPEHDCILCISRLGHRYILEDGRGHILFENDNLLRLAEQAAQALRRRKTAAAARLAVFWCAVREFFEEKAEPVLAEPIEILAHVAPHLAAVA